MMTPEERAHELVEWLPIEGTEPNDYARQGIAAAIRAAVEAERAACATLADEIAAAHMRIGAQGRFTVDYREGAVDAAAHTAHMIRTRNK